MVLLVGFYNDAVPRRMEEFIECLQRNAANSHIEKITVFIEDPVSPAEAKARFPALRHPKIKPVYHGRRLTFAHLLEYANRHLNGTGVIVANADIYFDETLALLDGESLTGTMLCLSRWDQATDGTFGHFDAAFSQDAWVFEPPLPHIPADFLLGKPACENRLAYEAARAGLKLLNPSRSLRARHLHNSGVRRYTPEERLKGPTRLIPPSFLEPTANAGERPHALWEGFPSHRGIRTECMANARCREIEAMLAPYFDGAVPRGLRRELLRAVSARTEGPLPPTDEPLAAVAFRETMGYTLARLECGVSTHNNDARPLVSVPPALAGLTFTQVVSCHSAPVALEFRTPGRLFVLAASGWEGYEPAVAFLDDAGWREPGEPLRTADGTIFEPWSLAGDAGERVVIPIQVMLAAAELIRME